MGEGRSINPLVEQFKRGGVARDLRLMAAQAALPLKPEDLLELLHHLLRDPDPEVAETAGRSMAALPAEELRPLLKDRETAPELLAWGLVAREESELREVVLQNTSLPDEAVEGIAGQLPEAQAELVVINQVRLLRRTSLLEALEKNPNLNNDQRRRLRELRETFKIGEAAPPVPPPPAAPEPPPEEALPPPPAEEAPPLSAEEAVEKLLTDEEKKDEEKISLVKQIYTMNTAQKLIAALKGGRELRTILIRDPNRLVSGAVLGSPKLTETEVESIAAMRNVSDDILRQIGRNRDWTKRYSVVANLVKNPRTPLAISLGMVSRLNPRDIKSMSVDRNVPEAIRKQAKRFVKGGDTEKK